MAPPTGEDRVRSILAVKEYVARKIEEYEAEIEMLRSNLELLDSTLTRSSFAKASDLLRGEGAAAAGGASSDPDPGAAPAGSPPGPGGTREGAAGGRGQEGSPAGDPGPGGGEGGAAEMTSIVGPGGQVLARAHVTDDRVSIVMADGIDVDAESDQIQEFLLGKVVGRMKREDAVAVEDGKIEAGRTVDVKVESDGARLVSITVSRYRERERSNEIVGTARWAINQLVGGAASGSPRSASPAAGAGPE